MRKDFTDTTTTLPDKFRKHYEEVSKLLAYKVSPPEGQVNRMGYRFLQQKQFNKSESFFKMNVENYPESFNAYDSYGDYFEATGDKPKAIANFKKALSMKESSETRKKLERLLK